MSHPQFLDILRNARSRHDEVRKPAEAELQRYETENLIEYIHNLAKVLADSAAPADLRSLAGITLKNLASAKSDVRKAQLAERWLSQDQELIDSIHITLLNNLKSPVKEVRAATTSAIAAFAAIEIPNYRWLDLLPKLSEVTILNIAPDNLDTILVCACLDAIGYVLDALEQHPEVDVDSNRILNTIFKAITDSNNDEIILSALHALNNSVVFCSKNFENINEAQTIYDMLKTTLNRSHPGILETTWKCFTNVIYHYYNTTNVLPQNMSVIYPASVKHISAAAEAPAIATQAIEFWITLADQEHMIALENAENESTSIVPSFGLCSYALTDGGILSAMTSALCTQSPDPEDEDWTPATAAGLCLTTFVQFLGDDVFKQLLPFAVQMSTNQDNWRFCEAGVLTFGCIMECSDISDKYVSNISQMVVHIVSLFPSKSIHVQNTSIWAISQVMLYQAHLLSVDDLSTICHGLLGALDLSNKAVSYACIALAALGENLPNLPTKHILGSVVSTFMTKLLHITETRTSDANTLVGCYEAISQLVKAAPPELDANIQSLLPIFIQRLISLCVGSADIGHTNDDLSTLQGLVCGALESIVKRVSYETLAPCLDAAVTALINVMQSKSTVAHEEALIALGAIIRSARLEFKRYMNSISPIIIACLQRHDDASLLQTCFLTISTIAISFEGEFEPYAYPFYQHIEKVMQSDVVLKEVKLDGFELFVDYALALGAKFTPYIDSIVGCILSAAPFSVWDSSKGLELYEYCGQLTAQLTSCISGIFTALCSESCVSALAPHIVNLMQYMLNVLANNDLPETDYANACEFFADLFTYSTEIAPEFPNFLFNSQIGPKLLSLEFRRSEARKALKRANNAYRNFLALFNNSMPQDLTQPRQ